MSAIASSIPGRIRLRHAALRNPLRLQQLEDRIGEWAHVQSAASNPKAGSLLVRYDAAALNAHEFAARCETALAELLPRTEAPAPVAAPRPLPRGGTRRVRANRLAKRGMLASLALSMLLAAAGSKRWHAMTGVFFLHALGVHLWVHRHHLVR